MVAEKSPEVAARLWVLHEALAKEGPTERTGRVLKSVADICDPVRKFFYMWEAASGAFMRRQAAIAAVVAGMEYLK